MDNLDNFSPCVSHAVRNDIRQLVEGAAAWMDTLNGDTFGDEVKIEPVEYKSRDGFISFNDGGFSVTQSYFNGTGSGIYHTTKEREFYEGQQDRCFHDYCTEFDKDPKTFSAYQDDNFAQFESDYLGELYSILEFEIFADKDTGKIQVSLLLHYLDAPYHRSKSAEVIYCEKFTRAEIGHTARILDNIKQSYLEA